jgi:hypothetical protein
MLNYVTRPTGITSRLKTIGCFLPHFDSCRVC